MKYFLYEDEIYTAHMYGQFFNGSIQKWDRSKRNFVWSGELSAVWSGKEISEKEAMLRMI